MKKHWSEWIANFRSLAHFETNVYSKVVFSGILKVMLPPADIYNQNKNENT